MKFKIEGININIATLARTIGYRMIFEKQKEYSLVRPLMGNNFPRFHIYIRNFDDAFELNLHLDQKQPSYSKTTAHSGEYDGELVENEVQRIKNALK